MRNFIKNIIKEEINDRYDEKFYNFIKSYMDKNYELFLSNRYDQYGGDVIMVYRFEPLKNDKEDYYDLSFDMKKDGTLYNTPATLELKENLSITIKELEKFLLRYVKEYH